MRFKLDDLLALPGAGHRRYSGNNWRELIQVNKQPLLLLLLLAKGVYRDYSCQDVLCGIRRMELAMFSYPWSGCVLREEMEA